MSRTQSLLRRSFQHRLSAAFAVLLVFGLVSFATRLALLAASPETIDGAWGQIASAFLWGAAYDLTTGLVLLSPIALYLALLPQRLFSSRWHTPMEAAFCFALVSCLLFIAIAEWTFWSEFSTRFNFIAVDYLIYTREVVANILESYPVSPILLLLALVAGVATTAWWTSRWRSLWRSSTTPLSARLLGSAATILAAVASLAIVGTRMPPDFGNPSVQELSRNGPYSFVAAFRGNELSYASFFAVLPMDEANARLRDLVAQPRSHFLAAQDATTASLLRRVANPGPERLLNVVQITVESLSARYLGVFGDTRGLTPQLDALAEQSMLFRRFYATGNRTVRGLEALSLGLPPTPGRSVVKRPGNGPMFSLGSVFRSRGYRTQFLYGGYGYFDNMNAFFETNGYQVIDRASVPSDEIRFANAWGASDEDVLRWSLDAADQSHADGQPFFQLVLTTSNHRPFTYPDGRIDIPSHTGRHGGVKYTDWAIGDFLRQARSRDWFDETIFIVVADHCAGTTGRVELPPARYRIPLMIYAPKHVEAAVVEVMGSQVDLLPTLLGLLGWTYDTRSFGRDLLQLRPGDGRALIANHQALGVLTPERLVVLRPRARTEVFRFDPDTDEVAAAGDADGPVRDAIAIYQTAGYLLTNRLYGEISDQR